MEQYSFSFCCQKILKVFKGVWMRECVSMEMIRWG